MKDRAEIVKWRRDLRVALARLKGMTEAQASIPKVTLEVVDISFSQLQNPEERTYFMNLPTSFVLPPEDIDQLRDVAGRLLRESADYSAVVNDFGTTARE